LFTSNVEQEIEVIKNENRNIKGIIKTCSGWRLNSLPLVFIQINFLF
jgi:hypothetical protein